MKNILCIVGWKTIYKLHGNYVKIAKLYRLIKKCFPSLRALYLEEKNSLSSVSRLPLEDFTENLYIALAKNALRIISIWLRSVQKHGHFTWTAKCFPAAAWLPSDGFSSKFIPRPLHTCSRKVASLVAICH